MRFTRAAALAAALTVPAVLHAQTPRQASVRLPTGGNQASANGEARTLYNEFQQIQARLQAAHNRVMQDPQVRGQQEAFMRDVKAAMLRVDPGLDALAARVETMQGQAQAAQQRGDRAELQRLNADLGTIQQRFIRAQQQVLRQAALRTRAQQLEETLHARMLRVEPETDRLLARGREIQSRLMATRRQ